MAHLTFFLIYVTVNKLYQNVKFKPETFYTLKFQNVKDNFVNEFDLGFWLVIYLNKRITKLYLLNLINFNYMKINNYK